MKIARILLAAALVASAAACSSDPTGIADRATPQGPRNATSATAAPSIIGGVVPTVPGVEETVNSLFDVPCVEVEVVVNGIRTTVMVCGEGDGGAWMGSGT